MTPILRPIGSCARETRGFEGLPDVESRVTRPVLFSFQTPIEVEIHGDEAGAVGGLAANA